MSDEVARADEADDHPPVPFSFKLMVVLAVLYLGWRLVQGIVLLVRWIN